MPTLNDLQSVSIRGNLIGAYDEKYLVQGLDLPVSQTELLQYILDNLGGGSSSGENDITESAGAPSGAPGAGEPLVYQNTTTGVLFVWDGSQWNEVGTGSGEDDVTEGSGAPGAAPGAGEPQIYQDTDNGNLYVYNGSAWVLVSAIDDITEGAGPPVGAPGAGEPLIYQDTGNGNVYTWDGSQWNLAAVVASNGLTKTGADVELGGTLEKNTDVEVDAFTLRFGRLLGSLLAYLRIVPGTALINLFSRDNTAGTESGLNLLPGSATMEVDDATNVGQLAITPTSIALITSESSVLQNRVILTNEKVELQAERLELKTPDAATSSVGDVLTILNSVTGEADFRPVPSGGLSQYEASGVNGAVDLGSFVTASAAGITYERTGGAGQNTEGTFTIPAGVLALGLTVHFTAGQAPGSTFYLNVDYLSSARPVNGSQNSVIPPLATVATKPATFSDANPATNYIHSGTPIQVGIAQVDDNGTRTRIRYKITNYSQQVGSNASILTLKLA